MPLIKNPTVDLLREQIVPLYSSEDAAPLQSLIQLFVQALATAPIPMVMTTAICDMASKYSPEHYLRIWFRPRTGGLPADDNYVVVVSLRLNIETKVVVVRILRGHRNAIDDYQTKDTTYSSREFSIEEMVEHGITHLKALYMGVE